MSVTSLCREFAGQNRTDFQWIALLKRLAATERVRLVDVVRRGLGLHDAVIINPDHLNAAGRDQVLPALLKAGVDRPQLEVADACAGSHNPIPRRRMAALLAAAPCLSDSTEQNRVERASTIGERLDVASLKRVVIVDGSVAVTGAFIAALHVAEALRHCARTSVVLPSDSTIRPEDYAQLCDIVHLPLAKIRRRLGSVVVFVPLTLYSGLLLRLYLARSGCHALLVNDFYFGTAPVLRLLGYRRPILTWVRIDPTRFGRIGRLLLAGALRASDRIIAVSDFIRSKLPTDAKITRLYDAVAPAAADLPKARPSRDGRGRRRIVYVGNYIEGKGQDHAIAVFASLSDRHPDADLAFYGADMGLAKNRAYRQRLESEARAMGLERRIFFGDFVKDTSAIFAEATLALNFSESESFSFTCLEASACGLPLVATRSGGPQEIVVDGVTGLLVDCGDLAAMRRAVDTLLGDETLASTLGSNAARYVRKEFSFAAFAQEIAQLAGFA